MWKPYAGYEGNPQEDEYGHQKALETALMMIGLGNMMMMMMMKINVKS